MTTKKLAGQGNVEYALILLLTAVAVIIIMQLMGISVRQAYCVVAGGLGVKNCGATTICQDDFADMGGSTVKNGNWTASNGQLCTTGGGGMVYNKCSMGSGMTTTDYTASLNVASLTAGNGYGIFFHATDTGAGINGYAFQYDPGLGGYVIRKWVNGAEIYNPVIAVSYAPGFNWYGQPHNLSIKVVGNTFIGYVDGQQVVTGTDPNNTFPSGGSAIRTWDSSNLCVDQFSLNPNTP